MENLIYILPFLYFSIIVFYLWKKNPLKDFGIKPNWNIGILSLKVLGGVALWAIYTYIYPERSTADNFRFFDDAKIMHQALFEDPLSYLKLLIGFDESDPKLQKYIVQMFNWDKEYNYFMYNDSRTMLRFNAICLLFSFGNYHVHTIVMSLFSLIGGLYLFKAFYPFLKEKKHLLLISIFCIPSVLFYSSGVLKEGVLMTGIGFFFYALFGLQQNIKRIIYWLLLIVGTIILLTMKIYVFICLVPAILYFMSNQVILKNNPFIFFMAFNLIAFLAMYGLSIIMPDQDIFYLLYKKKDDFTNVAMQYEAGSFIHTPDLRPDPISFLTYIPFAIYTVIMRPYLWEGSSLLMKAAASENIMLIICMVISLFTMTKKSVNEKRLIYFLISFIFYLYILIGFTTPVLGAISRYKVPALPFVLIICLLMIDSQKIKKIFPIQNL